MFVGLMGVAVGPVYVLGFAMLQQEVHDDLRGRVFSSLNTLVRVCILLSMVVGPLLAAFFGGISTSLIGGEIEMGERSYELPGVRIALWLASSIIIFAAAAAWASLRAGDRAKANGSADPS